MSFDKKHLGRKDHREPYTFHDGSQRFDRSCRPGGSCPYCKSGRHHAERRDDTDAQQQIEDFHNLDEIDEAERTQREWDEMWDGMEQQDRDELHAWEEWQYGQGYQDYLDELDELRGDDIGDDRDFG